MGAGPEPPLSVRPRLYTSDSSAEGFEWVDRSDTRSTVVSFLRRGGTSIRVRYSLCAT